MKIATIAPVLILAVLLGVAGWTYVNWQKYAPTTYVQESTDGTGATTTTTVNTKTGTSTQGAPLYTSAQVSAHADATSCFTVISGKVYDLTMWVNVHPGGREAILSLCGNDGTQAFMDQHRGAKKEMDILARFYIGKLAQQ